MNPTRPTASTAGLPLRRSLAVLSAMILLLTTAGALLSPQPASAQPRARARAMSEGNPIERVLFPPELVMRHQAEISLTEEQRQVVVTEVQALQSDIVPLQFELGEAMEELARVLREPGVDEATALAHIEKITALEARVKRRHLQLLIRIKNLLSAQQQQTLRRLRRGR